MHIYLIRHPRPDIAAGICYGQSDIAADASHCSEVVLELAAKLPPHVRIVSSPLRRCAVLAHALAAVVQSSAPLLDAWLMEMNFGTWELCRWDDIARADIDAWAADTVHYRAGGGESLLQVAARVVDFLKGLQSQPDAAIALVCHAGPIRLMRLYQHGMLPVELAAAAAAGLAAGTLDIRCGECVELDLPAAG
ncbi:histidine phosphatase family protein [Undibacterium sp.]|uniref:histidine phosphatase family protein n=1 Tax=Undibacterium sp. TaxID=1914977 RepID=UPI00374D5463